MQEVCNSDMLEYPPPTRGAKGPYKDRWCEFHKVKGHDTEECWDLMNQIERLIKDGYLKRYVVGRGRQEFSRQGGRGRGRAQESQPNSGVAHPGSQRGGVIRTVCELKEEHGRIWRRNQKEFSLLNWIQEET
ncbi:hypothetical protein SESBI_44834 [Sesbania bispinosa]|nr:hypothetical protein SESBI_44834 [Sesbania bispinosa]